MSARASTLPGLVHVAATPQEVAEQAASWLARRAEEARVQHGYFAVALAGGSTPHALYEILARPPYRDSVAWATWMVFYGDERAVPPTDEQSNHRMASQTLLDHVPVPPERIHRMEAERADLAQAAAEYASLMTETLVPDAHGAPRLHCVLLGVGENGHTASLFPGSPALQAEREWVVPSVADYAPYDRLTLTFPVINAAETVAFLVTGANKGAALRSVVAGSVPAARVRPDHGTLLWFLDEAAEFSMQNEA